MTNSKTQCYQFNHIICVRSLYNFAPLDRHSLSRLKAPYAAAGSFGTASLCEAVPAPDFSLQSSVFCIYTLKLAIREFDRCCDVS